MSQPPSCEESELVRDVFAAVFLGSPTKPVWEFADESVFLSEQQSAELARYDSAETPWTREIQDAIRDPETLEVACMKASRTGVSEAGYNVFRYMPLFYPGNALLGLNSLEKARDVMKRDLIPSIKALAREKLTGDPNDITGTRIRMKHMDIKATGSGSPSAFRGEWYRFVLLDELEDHQVLPDGTTYDLVKSRFATVSDYLLMVIGKPQAEGGPVHDAYLRGTQEKWMVPCPRCSGRIEFKWDQMRYSHARDEMGEWDLDLVGRDTWYQCQLCDGRIDESEKFSMVGAGEWVATPKNERIGFRGKPVAAEPGRRSFHISALYSPFPQVTWGKLAQMWVACSHINVSEGKKDDFWKDKLGLPVAPKELHITNETILALVGGYSETVYLETRDKETGKMTSKPHTRHHGERFSLCFGKEGKWIADLPVDPILITIAVDKQAHFLKFTVLAWNEAGESWLIDYGVTDEVKLLTEIRVREYRFEGRTHRIYGGVMDRGYAPRSVYKTCAAAQKMGWHLYPSLGSGSENDRYTADSLREKEDTLKSGHRVRYYQYHDHSIKFDFYFGCVQNREAPRLYLPDPVPQDIVTELTSEYWDEDKQRFIHDKTLGPNDYGDTLKMQKGVVWPVIVGPLAKAFREKR